MGNVERLEKEVDYMYKRFNSLCDELSQVGGGGGLSCGSVQRQVELQIEEEVVRSSRYNHFFALAVFPVKADLAGHYVKELRKQLRASDVVTMVGWPKLPKDEIEEKDNHKKVQRLAVLMPETDRKGAQVAMKRVNEKMGDTVDSFGCAVYPDDGTDAKSLLGNGNGINEL